MTSASFEGPSTHLLVPNKLRPAQPNPTQQPPDVWRCHNWSCNGTLTLGHFLSLLFELWYISTKCIVVFCLQTPLCALMWGISSKFPNHYIRELHIRHIIFHQIGHVYSKWMSRDFDSLHQMSYFTRLGISRECTKTGGFFFQMTQQRSKLNESTFSLNRNKCCPHDHRLHIFKNLLKNTCHLLPHPLNRHTNITKWWN